jgi:hypothetical protein
MSIAHNRDPSPFHGPIETQRDAVVQPSTSKRGSFQSALASAASSRARSTSCAPCRDWSAPRARRHQLHADAVDPTTRRSSQRTIEWIASAALGISSRPALEGSSSTPAPLNRGAILPSPRAPRRVSPAKTVDLGRRKSRPFLFCRLRQQYG